VAFEKLFYYKMKKFKFINNQSKKEFLALPENIQMRFASDLNAL